MPSEKPTRGLECTCAGFLPSWCPSLGRHAPPPGASLRHRQARFLPCLLRVFRKSRGSGALPLGASITLAVKIFFRLFQLLWTIPGLIGRWTFLCICFQLWRKMSHLKKKEKEKPMSCEWGTGLRFQIRSEKIMKHWFILPKHARNDPIYNYDFTYVSSIWAIEFPFADIRECQDK